MFPGRVGPPWCAVSRPAPGPPSSGCTSGSTAAKRHCILPPMYLHSGRVIQVNIQKVQLGWIISLCIFYSFQTAPRELLPPTPLTHPFPNWLMVTLCAGAYLTASALLAKLVAESASLSAFCTLISFSKYFFLRASSLSWRLSTRRTLNSLVFLAAIVSVSICQWIV